MKYYYRGLPCNISTDTLWCVVGQDLKGGCGVLEWCYDEKDALQQIKLMRLDNNRFVNLTAEKWKD